MKIQRLTLSLMTMAALPVLSPASLFAQGMSCDPQIETCECDPEVEICEDYCSLNPYDAICYDPGGEGDTFCTDNPELCDDQDFDYGEFDEFEGFGDEEDLESCQIELDYLLDLLEYAFSDGDYDDDGDIDAPNYDGEATSLPGTGTLGDLSKAAKQRAAANLLTKQNVAELKARVLAANNKANSESAAKDKLTNEKATLTTDLQSKADEVDKWKRKYKRQKRKLRGRK